MARTAPVPNIPAIPGMNPGVFVMGGGGSGGGGSGKGGKGAGGGQGASGENGGEGADGGGAGAGTCGQGSGGGCMNPAHGNTGTHAGDPIDPVTGRMYTLRETDLPLVGPLVVALQRSYSSADHERDVGLGYGWSHTLAWALQKGRRSLLVHAPFGRPVRYPLKRGHDTRTVRGVGTFRIDEDFILLADEQGQLYRFAPTSSGKVVSYRLTELFDRAGNVITLDYDAQGLLRGFIDSAGRRGHVRRNADKRISRFEIETSWNRTLWFRAYEYDSRGNLVSSFDPAGRRVHYDYDDEHRMVRQVFGSGRSIHYRYDGFGRAVESWVDYGGTPDPALADDAPATLADGVTKAKGMLHVRLEFEEGSTTVIDSRQVRRFDHDALGNISTASGVWVESLRYDDLGRLTAYADPNDNVTTLSRDEHGRVTAVTDPIGAVNTFSYDANGYVRETVDALGHALSYLRDPAGNLLEVNDAVGLLLKCGYDHRGLRVSAEMPNGGVTRFDHDAEGNLVRLVEPDGGVKILEVDDIGHIVAFTDPAGHRTVYGYDSAGLLQSVTLPNGATSTVEHDPDGHISAYHTPDGATWRLHWAGHNCVFRLDKGNGESLHFRYNREAQLVCIINENGETHRIVRDLAGRVIEETFFDGRRYLYAYDNAGRMTAHVNGAEERTEIERDEVGRVVKRVYHDGSEEAFDYDPEGRLIGASTGAVSTSYTYDERGRLRLESSIVDGERVSVDNLVDSAGFVMERRLSAGPHLIYRRDLAGRLTRVELPGGGTIERTLDPLGREVLRTLPGGGSIVSSYDASGALAMRRIVSPGAAGPQGKDPAWVGDWPEGTTFGETFSVSAGGDLLEWNTSEGDKERYHYDALGRIVGHTRGSEHQRYTYQGAGLVHEENGPQRAYASGGVPKKRGEIAFEYDGELRRTAQRDGAGKETRYAWNGKGLLAAVRLPDGTRLLFDYDTDARLVRRRRVSTGDRVEETRYTWCQGLLVHEARYSVSGDERVITAERLYVYDDDGAPLAHRDTWHRDGVAEQRPWVHYVAGPADMPSLLVADDGRVLSKVRSTVWGQVQFEGSATTPLRFLGQVYDEDLGLCYNRHRYYDPALGLYINADPAGLNGGLGAFEYARSQPYRYADPLGLQPVTTTVTGGGITQTGHSTQHPDHSSPQGIHPVVHQALPQGGAFFTYDPTTGRGGVGQSYPAGRPPHTCGEPHALSNYIREWERQNNGGRELNPNDPRDRAKIQECLSSIDSISSQHDNGTPRAPCPNCSQLLANLQARYGAPSSAAIQPGFDNAGGTGAMTNYTPPLATETRQYLGPRRQYSA